MVKANTKGLRQLGVFAALGLILFLCAFLPIQTKQHIIVLKDSKLNFTPTKFYIIDVADGRVNRRYTAMLMEKGKSSPVQYDLKDGVTHSIKKFLDHNLHRDTLLKPVLLTIKVFNLIETKMPNGIVHGDLKVTFSFASQLSYENKHLVDFTEKISYSRGINEISTVETYLKKGINDGLNYFDKYSSTHAY